MFDARYVDYDAIKEQAKMEGRKVTEFIALSPGNDPFYVGTPADVAAARWFRQVWDATGYDKAHMRRIHYWLVSQGNYLDPNGEAYENTDRCWQNLITYAKKARYLGLVQIGDIVDNKNPKPTVFAQYLFQDVNFRIHNPEIDRPHIWIDGFNVPDAQPYHLEIWCEKSTMNDVLLPIAQAYGANLVTFEGEVSITACNDFVQRVIASGVPSKPTRVFYISDFDPAGNSMPVAMARKVEYLLAQENDEHSVKIKPIALNLSQIKQYNLPRVPIKETEKRAAKFEANFGSGAVELDALEALHPGVLRRIVIGEISEYYDRDAAQAVRKAQSDLERDIRLAINDIAARYETELKAIKDMLYEIQNVEIDVEDYEVRRAEATVDEFDEDWLFSSGRNYLDQLEFYRAHKEGG